MAAAPPAPPSPTGLQEYDRLTNRLQSIEQNVPERLRPQFQQLKNQLTAITEDPAWLLTSAAPLDPASPITRSIATVDADMSTFERTVNEFVVGRKTEIAEVDSPKTGVISNALQRPKTLFDTQSFPPTSAAINNYDKILESGDLKNTRKKQAAPVILVR
jgi:hypothetical protein